MIARKPTLIVILGPTASGKTSLSIKLAQRFNGEIVSADSRQVYRRLDIGSGKVTNEEMDGIPHHLLDVADPSYVYTVADYVRDARAAVADIHSRGKVPIIVGGTFFYIDALLGRFSAPEVPPNPALRIKLEQQSTEALYEMLQEKDPRRAAEIDQHNKVRLVRALEIIEALGSVPVPHTQELYDMFLIGIDIEKQALHQNIERRIDERLALGMIDEVRNLLASGVTYARLESFGLEYRCIARFLQDPQDEATLRTCMSSEIKNFAKRQMTWLKRDASIHWFRKDDLTAVEHSIEEFLKS